MGREPNMEEENKPANPEEQSGTESSLTVLRRSQHSRYLHLVHLASRGKKEEERKRKKKGGREKGRRGRREGGVLFLYLVFATLSPQP